MTGTVRIVLGVLLIVVGIFGLLLFFLGVIAIVLGAVLVWSGRSAQREEEMGRQLQFQQAQLLSMQQAQTRYAVASGYSVPLSGAPGVVPPPPAWTGGAPSAACPRCGRPASWIAQYGRWYCYADQQYL